ncbi:cytosine permease [Leifsonia sp. YAF41]|uniref:purine-cytosine permease family protein n=1 Tax=Leifsonia sp. YAF41 TaxID=3233086 RepID=UPI003F9E233A
MSTDQPRTGALEQRSIDYIPLNERHGKPWHLFTVWFSSNLQITGLVTGALAVIVGLDLVWAIITIVVGNLIGGVFMAYHSVQGPRMGVPQMIQSRAQFGFLGALLPVAIVLCMYAGFAIEGGVVTGQALATWAHIPFASSVIIQASIGAVIAIVGYRLIHITSRVVTVISTILFAVLTIALLSQLPSELPVGPPPAFGTVLLALSIFISWQITWAPYVSDYSRYLPANTPASTTFAWTYVGSTLGASWVMILGALAASISAENMGEDAIGFLSGLVPGLSGVILFALLISVIPAGANGAYGAYLSFISAVSAEGNGRATPRVRTIFVIVFSVIVSTITIAANGDILGTVQQITLFLLYLLVPWTAINLTDYYFVRKGNYEVAELFKPRGVYKLVNWPAVIIYLVAIAAEIPFINSTLFVGPFVPLLGGADLAWIVGLVLPTVLYLGYAQTQKVKSPQSDLAADIVG